MLGGSSLSSGSAVSPGTSASAGAAMLGDADTTSRPAPPQPAPMPSKKIVDAQRVPTVFVAPGFTSAAVLVLLGFAGAMCALLAANRASAKRR